MRLLLDTHLLLWTAAAGMIAGGAISKEALSLIQDSGNELYFSPVSVWEVAIKSASSKREFQVDPHLFRRAVLDAGYSEIPISSEHAVAVAHLPDHHKDPFDRLLIAQAMMEGIVLLTSDETMARYAGPVRRV